MLTHPLFGKINQEILIYSGMLTHVLKNRFSASLNLFRDVDPPAQAIIVRSFLMSFALKK
jgi:hypothetical protein